LLSPSKLGKKIPAQLMFAQKKKDHDSMDHRWGIVGSEIV
jgi:hypothetical protein